MGSSSCHFFFFFLHLSLMSYEELSSIYQDGRCSLLFFALGWIYTLNNSHQLQDGRCSLLSF
ncbi:hypothetical protein Sjap_007357 [Stephania japonica]|uniref:Uncharacterized protein n=1 Tax=Stephania japonica TaxID=461633 RepID=A0AAP0P9Y2_9MAGN